MNLIKPFVIGQPHIVLHPKMANRHGIIAGATGTGKTITLKVLAEHFSDLGVPVFLSDVKGDLASLAQPIEMNEGLQKRINLLAIESFNPASFPVRCFDIFGELGHPFRTTITDMGPMLLARILNLNDVQTGVLHVIFRVADDQGWLLIDLKDLRSMCQFVSDNASELTVEYGTVSKVSVGAIVRSILSLEDQGGDHFFGEPAFEIEDLMKTDINQRGFINVLASEKLLHFPAVYSTFLLWLLSELFENLPEVGDLDKPKLVFFFDEAHLLFNDAPKVLVDKIELVVRLIRSKGVGVYFVTQNPIDIPDKILSQCGNRVQHALRAYTPKEQKAVKLMAQTFRQNPELSIEEVITELKTGEALVSLLDESGRPSIVERTLIVPPRSKIGVIDDQVRQTLIENSPFFYKYGQVVDRVSAYEILKEKLESEKAEAVKESERLAEEKARALRLKEEEAELKRLEKEREKYAREYERAAKKKTTGNTEIQKLAKSFMGTMSSSIGREIARGVFGSLKRK